jgi:AcrR family transcriptional regulator
VQDRRPTLERILEAASRVFARQGYQGTTMTEVASEAGLTKPTIYNHVENKASLYHEMLRYIHARAEAELQQAADAVESFPDKLRAVVKTLVAFSRRHADLIRVVHTAHFLPEDVRPQVDQRVFMDPERSTLFRLIRQGVEQGELDCDPHDLAIVIHGAAATIAFVRLVQPEIGPRWDGAEDRVFDLIYRGARKQP